MRRRNFHSAGAAALLLLAGCGKKGGEAGGGDNGAEAATTVTEPVNDSLYEDQTNSAVPIKSPSPQATPSPQAAPSSQAAGAVPAAFQGRWGLVEADCDPAKDYAAKGLMVVEPARLVFYESRGSVTSARPAGDGRLTLRLSYSGEGQNWTADETLTLLDEGRTLTRSQTSPATTQRYQRCPA